MNRERPPAVAPAVISWARMAASIVAEIRPRCRIVRPVAPRAVRILLRLSSRLAARRKALTVFVGYPTQNAKWNVHAISTFAINVTAWRVCVRFPKLQPKVMDESRFQFDQLKLSVTL